MRVGNLRENNAESGEERQKLSRLEPQVLELLFQRLQERDLQERDLHFV